MKFIEKIEIKNFRSFLGTRKDDKAEIFDITDLNIFSGANDSGKSNILRALNLFFNDSIDNIHSFNFESDFNLSKKHSGHKVIEIKIYFKVAKRKFSISKFYDRTGYRNFEYRFAEKDTEIIIDSRAEQNRKRYKNNDFILNKENGYRRYAIQFISSISFSYVPAIREERFFSHLYGKIIYKIKRNEEKEIEKLQTEKRKIKRWRRTIQNKSEKKDFLKNLKKSSWRNKRTLEIDVKIESIPTLKNAINELENQINAFSENLFTSVAFLASEFRVGSDLKDFFESFDIGTGIDKEVSLRLRGDGVQAKFIPEMLNFLDSISTDQKYFIWGFEEPENSSEYKNQIALATKLKNHFSESKQIFVTTHSEEFLSLYDGKEINKDKRNTNLYHVKKVDNKSYSDFSTVSLFNVEENVFEFASVKSALLLDLGSSLVRAKYAKELKEKEKAFLNEKMEIEAENEALKTMLHTSKKPILYVEDTNIDIYKIAYLKVHSIPCTSSNFVSLFENKAPFVICRSGGAGPLAGRLSAPHIDDCKDIKLVGLFDFDREGREKFHHLKKSSNWEGIIEGSLSAGFFKKRKDHPNFHALLLPIPSRLAHLTDLEWEHFVSYVEVENLLPLGFLQTNGYVQKKTLPSGEYYKVKSTKKDRIWKKLFELPEADFIDFIPLFDKVEEFLGVNNA